jgi:hypothetical protein
VVLAFAGAALAITLGQTASEESGGTGVSPGGDTALPPIGLDESQANLRAGDCIEDPGSGPIETIKEVACDTPGALEVTNTFDIIGYTTFPGVDTADQVAVDQCFSSAITYIGPTAESWAAGDRLVVCLK